MVLSPALLAVSGASHFTVLAQPWLTAAALICAVAATVWARAASRLARAARRIEEETRSATTSEAARLARIAFNKDLHAAVLYAVLAAGLFLAGFSKSPWFEILLLGVTVPGVISLRYGPRVLAEARLAEQRSRLERRAEEVLAQEDLAPRRWAARLAPEDLPAYDGFDIGLAYEPGTGVMAGDFYDVFATGPNRLAVFIGDVAGHGIEPSITAFQVKHVLRIFLHQYRDPAQALEEINKTLLTMGRPEDMVSVSILIFDTAAGTLRHASAGHPPALVWHQGEVLKLSATGPLLALDPNGTYYSRDIPLDVGDLAVLYTDGLTEARSGGQLFGEERVAQAVRRDPGEDTTVICKTLLEAARDFSSPLIDDVAILAIRRV
ncbi:MAG: PP2C family protein-serine/threonine phosphatase [Actinomycetota bacterium]|jgi:serine phosphatase RsbU (regulator of sigma subunit)|nr:PP2C family protein-serine/threonine phosphatase [Actinomycetota bacterium]